MQATKSNHKQGFLFSEPSFKETAVWCELNDEIDPAQWAYLCRYLGSMGSNEFKKARKRLCGNPDALWRRIKRIFSFEQKECLGVPVVKMGYMD